MNKRLWYLDSCRGIAILTIVFGHILEEDFLRIWFSSFQVPIFFVISGILICHTQIEKRTIKQIIISRFKGFIVPYISFELVAIIIWMIVNNEINYNAFRWNVIDSLLLYQKVGATWYLPVAFISEICFIVLLKIVDKKRKVIVFSVILSVIPFFIQTENHFLIILLRCLGGIGVLALGYCSYDFVQNKKMQYRYIVIALIITMYLSNKNGSVGLYGLKFGNPIIYIICFVLGSYSLLFMCKNNFLPSIQYFGKNSLIIMATHQVFFRTVVDKITDKMVYGYFEGSIIFLVTICFELVVIYLINNYAPFMLGKFKKE